MSVSTQHILYPTLIDKYSIKPLQTDDIRQRRINGRLQITPDGRHLVDGYAYGRPALRTPARPDIRIPPRKRVRLLEGDPNLYDTDHGDSSQDDDQKSDDVSADLSDDTEDMSDIPSKIVLKDLEDFFDSPDSPEKRRKTAELCHVLNLDFDEISEKDATELITSLDAFLSSGEGSEEGRDDMKLMRAMLIMLLQDKKGPIQGRKSVTYEGQDDDDDEEDDDDDDFDPELHDSESDDQDEYWDPSEDEVRAIEAGDASDSSWEGIDSGAATPTTPATSALAADSDSDSASSDSSDDTSDSGASESENSSSDSSSDDDSDAPSVEPIKQQDNKTPSAPFEGKTVTRKRNERRRDNKKLKYLVSQGVLPKTANRADMLQWQSANDSARDKKASEGDVDGAQSAVPFNTSDQSPSSELNVQPAKKASTKSEEKAAQAEELNRQREALLARIANGGVDVQESLVIPQSDDVKMTDATNDVESASSEPTRRKLDLPASQRLLFGSLGVRRPKNESERQKLRTKLAAQGQRKAAKQPMSDIVEVNSAIATEAEDDAVDPELWKKKINLSAVECVTEGVEYIKPPYPFHQRWDPQMRDKKRKRVSQSYTSDKKTRKADDYEEIRDNNGLSESYDATAGDALDYGDEDQDNDDSSSDSDYGEEGDGYWDEVEYLDGNTGSADAASAQLLNETSGNPILSGGEKSSSTEQGDDTDLPPLPTDLEGLPALTKANALAGALITFSRFEVSAATNWTPGMSPVRVAIVSAVHEDDTLELRLAKRDVPQKKYDSQGRRMLSGFETDMGDEEEEGVVELELAEIIDGRLIQKAPVKDEAASVDVEAGAEGAEAEGTGEDGV